MSEVRRRLGRRVAEIEGAEVNEKHRSFRLTKPPKGTGFAYMQGKRVKPRLRCVSFVVPILATSVIVLSIAVWALTLPWLLTWFAALPWVDDDVLPSLSGVYLILALLLPQFGIMLASPRVFIWLGWMTPNEAKHFFQVGRRGRWDWYWHKYWPISWLEPIPNRLTSGRSVTTESPSTALRAACELDRFGDWEEAIEHYQFVIRTSPDEDDREYARRRIERLEGLLRQEKATVPKAHAPG